MSLIEPSIETVERITGDEVSRAAEVAASPAGHEVRPRSDLYGVALAGVHAWGGCLLDEITYRPLLPVAGRPLVCHALLWLRNQGVGSMSLCANSDTKALRRYLRDGSDLGLSLEYYEDVMPRGPAGCVRDASDGRSARYLVVVYGTVVPAIDLDHLLGQHEETGAVLTMVASEGQPGGSRGVPFLRPAGIYVFSAEALRHVPYSGYQDIKETLIPRLRAAGDRVATYKVNEDMVGQVRDTSSYVAVNKWAVERACAQPREPRGYVRMGKALVHESAQLGDKVRLIGPMVIEADCVIGNEAVLVGPSVLGRGCRVAPRATISRSAIWSACRIGTDAVIDHSVVTDRTVVGDGEEVRGTVASPLRRHRSGRGTRGAAQRVARMGIAPARLPLSGPHRESEHKRGEAPVAQEGGASSGSAWTSTGKGADLW